MVKLFQISATRKAKNVVLFQIKHSYLITWLQELLLYKFITEQVGICSHLQHVYLIAKAQSIWHMDVHLSSYILPN